MPHPLNLHVLRKNTDIGLESGEAVRRKRAQRLDSLGSTLRDSHFADKPKQAASHLLSGAFGIEIESLQTPQTTNAIAAVSKSARLITHSHTLNSNRISSTMQHCGTELTQGWQPAVMWRAHKLRFERREFLSDFEFEFGDSGDLSGE